MATIPFKGVLRLGSKGTQPVAVKRGLWKAGFRHGWDSLGGDAIAAEVLGETAVGNLTRFQKAHHLTPDGVYGPVTHKQLSTHFDSYAVSLYLKAPPGPPPLQLPGTFTPTHETAGLPGYPAIDVFAKAGTNVAAPSDGVIRRLSGHDPAEGGVPGGAYGWSIYLLCPRGEYFLTHLGSRTVAEGKQVKRGDILGTVCDAAVAHMDTTLSHIHEGFHPAV